LFVQHIEGLIFSGELEPGANLPSESELASSLDLSRLTVREAFRSLEARGLLEVAHGRRPIVAHPNARPLSDFFSASLHHDARSLFELVEVRLAIESMRPNSRRCTRPTGRSRPSAHS
jgi:GntR family transcriptional repressor for pyruvate dehydrogenase complex